MGLLHDCENSWIVCSSRYRVLYRQCSILCLHLTDFLVHDPGLALEALQQGVERGVLVRQRPQQRHQAALLAHLAQDPDNNLTHTISLVSGEQYWALIG